jgi:uncharacterized protein
LAWLVLLAGIAGMGGYLLMLPEEHGGSPVSIALGPTDDTAGETETPGTEAQMPETQMPEAEMPETAMAETAMAEAPMTETPKEATAPRAEPTEAEAEAGAGAGELPRWKLFSQDFDDTNKRPRIAIILTGMGLSSATTEAAITQLPAAVTLSFTPYARRLDQWISLARTGGHEVMLDLPMEPTSYPDDDPGPRALLTALSPAQNVERLKWTLDRARGYVGLATVMGSRFTTSEEALRPVLETLKEQGLIYIDNRSSQESVAWRVAAKIGVPNALNDRTLDTGQANRDAIDGRLVQLEGVARADGFAVGMGRPYPVTIERLREWAKGLEERGFVLAPISAVVDRQRRHLSITQSTQAE